MTTSKARRFPDGLRIPFFPWVLDHVSSADIALFYHLLLFTGWAFGIDNFEEFLTPWLRLKSLAQRFRVGDRTIRRWVRECETAGLIERQLIRGHESRFLVHVPYYMQSRLAYLSKTDTAQLRRWVVRPRRSRRMRVSPNVRVNAFTCTPRYAVSWYYEKVRTALGILPPGSAGDLRLQFRKYLQGCPWLAGTWKRKEYRRFYTVMKIVIERWPAFRRLWAKEHGSHKKGPLPDYPPLGHVPSMWPWWELFARQYDIT